MTSIGAPSFEHKHVWQLDARDPVSARRVKRAILWKLAGLSAGEPEFLAVELIYGELLANVARHTPGPATVTLEERGDVAVLHVEDRGPAFRQPVVAERADLFAESGRGYWLISQFSRSTVVERTDDGNRVTVTLPLVQTLLENA